MDKLIVVLRYGGDFTCQMNDKWHWSGDSVKIIMVDGGISFEELLDKICKKLNLDRHTDIFEIKHDYIYNLIVTVSDEEDWEITKHFARSSVDLQLYLIFSPREEIMRIEASPGRKEKSKKLMTRGKGKKLMDKVSSTYQPDGCVIGGSSAQDDVNEEIVASNLTLRTVEEVESLRCSPPYSQWSPHDNEDHNVRYDCRNFDGGYDSKFSQAEIMGSFEENFADLPSFAYMIEQRNPGTRTHIHTDSENKFKYLFMALGAATRGFNFLRNVIAMDATFMGQIYKGTVLIASAMDSENRCYPIAWGVANGNEDAACWTYFLEHLRKGIPDRRDLVIVSDRGKGLTSAVKDVYPLADHGAYYYHLLDNLGKKFGNEGLAGYFYKAAFAYTESNFEKYFGYLKNKSPTCANWLQNEVKFEKWARVHHRVNRYEVMTSNHAEVLNNRIREAKHNPICYFLKFIVNLMGKWFRERRDEAEQWTTTFSPSTEKLISERYEKAYGWRKYGLGYDRWRVESIKWSGVVDFELRTCACGVFQIEQIPCEHTMAAAMGKRPNVSGQYVHDLVSRYYTVNTTRQAYYELIEPVPSKDQWMNIPDDVMARVVLPPEPIITRGRPKMTRYESSLEKSKKKYKCSI